MLKEMSKVCQVESNRYLYSKHFIDGAGSNNIDIAVNVRSEELMSTKK